MDTWTPVREKEISSAYRGITTPIREILDEIHGRGWEPHITHSKGQYTAKGSNPHGESVEAAGLSDADAAGKLLLKIMRRETIRSTKLAKWDTDWSNNLDEIAKAYAEAPVYDPNAAPAWKALADDSLRRAEIIKEQIKVEIVPDPEPYTTPQEMCEDVHKNKHFYVSSANSQHPMWSVEQNVAFRIVHDVLGHCVSGGDFGWEGENQACRAHFPLLNPLAQKALFTECIAQTAAGAYFRSFMPQKVVFIDDFIDQAQEKENSVGHQGVHPSQSIVPGSMPQAEPSTPQGLPWATQVPHQDFQGALPVFGATRTPQDPNKNWASGIEPMPDAAYLWGDDPLEAENVKDNAMKIDTQWWKLDEGEQRQAITNAFRVVLLSPRKDLKWNAIHYQDIMHVPASVTDPKRYWDTLEGRRESWNQARGYAPGSHKPYWKELAEFRRYIRGVHPEISEIDAQEKADREFMHLWSEEETHIAADPKNENKTADEIERIVSRNIGKRLKMITRPTSPETDHGHEQMHMLASAPPGIVEVDKDRQFGGDPEFNLDYRRPFTYDPESHQVFVGQLGQMHSQMGGPEELFRAQEGDGHDGWIVHHEAEGPITDARSENPGAIGMFGPENNDAVDALVDHFGGPPYHNFDRGDRFNFEGATQYDLEGQEAGKYGAFMGSHLKAISQISQHVDELLAAAQEDLKEHDGTGHHFRSKVLSLGISGVGPKVASFAWLLLCPGSSELATIDTHMMDVLGHDYTKEMNNRDYFKFERELSAGRDASGYNHVPLGQFQWGMWDYKRTGPGTHQDHSAMKPLDPKPHDHVDWAQKLPVAKDWEMPAWWQATQPARDQVGQQWDQDVATQFSRDITPHFAKRKTAGSSRIPWILWGQRVWVGSPGETFMSLARRELGYTMEDVWQRLPEDIFSAGVFDPAMQRLFPQDQISELQQETILRELQHGPQSL